MTALQYKLGVVPRYIMDRRAHRPSTLVALRTSSYSLFAKADDHAHGSIRRCQATLRYLRLNKRVLRSDQPLDVLMAGSAQGAAITMIFPSRMSKPYAAFLNTPGNPPPGNQPYGRGRPSIGNGCTVPRILALGTALYTGLGIERGPRRDGSMRVVDCRTLYVTQRRTKSVTSERPAGVSSGGTILFAILEPTAWSSSFLGSLR